MNHSCDNIVNNIKFFIRFPGPRSLLGPRPFHPYPAQNNHSSSERGRSSYRHSNNQQRSQIQSYGQQRQIFHMLQRIRQGQADTTNSQHDDLSNQYKDNTRYYNNQAKQCHINSMRDVDHRQVNIPQNRELNQQPTVWVNPSAFYEENQNKTFRNYDKEQNKAPLFDYTGHRPPSSDHYGGNLGQTSDKSNTFSRSVDDTVDIVRKRLQRRGSLHALDNNNPPVDQTEENKVRETTSSSYTNVDSQPEQPVKKKVNKTRNVKTNCDKIKTKIVHQLFKMDKDKIHKLMDNPNSSTKFEYAISSLITESQNSYNRHLRSVAEKSLCSSSSEFIHNDNNTIYEDTFMKHMQCILDPQDTVLLEDIKPMVLAELSKVLQLDDFEHRQEYDRQSNFCSSLSEQSHYSQYPSNESCNYENYQNEPYPPEDQSSYYEQKPSLLECPRSETSYASDRHRDYYDEQVESKHLFERRQSRRSRNRSRSRRSSSGGHKHRKDRRSTDSKSNEDKYRHRDPTPDEYRRITTPAPNVSITCGSPLPSNSECRRGTPIPLFDTNIEQLSDEDDPFAELDKQYHVAVDHNFIDDDLISQSQIPIIASTSPKVNKEISTTIHTPENTEHPVETSYTVHNAFQIKKAIDTQLHDMAKSPLKFSSRCDEPKKSTYDTKQETATCAEINSKEMVDSDEKTNEPQESSSDFKNTERNADKGKSNTLIKSSTPFRKRSIEEKPSHRKEKRKKSESEEMLTETNKQVLNKNIIINVNDCAAKSITEKCDVSKSLFNLFFSKEKSDNNSSKENLKLTTSNKISDRHIKRKEERTSNKSKNKESDNKKHDSISSSHSTLSPTETSVANSSVQTPTKADSKLKTIDMFLDHAKKPSLHQAHRNTAPIAITHSTVVETIKPPVIPSNRKITKKHVSTQVIRKASHKETQTIESKSSTSRFCQTERKRLMTRGMQTEPNYSRSTFKTTDGFERMKEIDMEIQTLLQEKFKLYSSIESKEGCPTNTMQSLGMAVLNVAPLNENDLNDDSVEDAIVDDFTNIPVEELEQIAFETVQEEKGDNAQERRSLRHKVLQRQRTSSLSPATTSSTNTKTKRKTKPPNISLIEQIITDDRPLEDIISLDYLEVLPVPSSKTYKKNKSKSKSKPHKKSTRVVKTSTKTDDYTIKECSVVLVREDLQSMLKSITELNKQSRINDVDETSNIKKSGTELSFKTKQIVELENVVEETVVSDIQFDMLDVSEDIVIGDSCEVKLSEKDENYTSTGLVNEEIIYDNSQQSIEETASAKIQDKSRECKVYDFLSDENLRRDSITVLGNADAVLAIEVSYH